MDSAERPYVFAAKIEKIWIMRVIDIPRDIGKTIRKMAGENSKHIPVHGWIEGLPFRNTLVIELCNNDISYVPTKKAFSEGSYEVVNSRVQSGGGERLVEAAVKLLNELKP